MNFVEVERDDLKKLKRTTAKERIEFLKRFCESGIEVAKVTNIPEEKDLNCLVTSLNSSAERYGFCVRASKRKKEVFLIKTTPT